MRKKIDRLLSLVIIGILLPLFVTIIGQRMQLEQVIYGDMQPNEDTTEARADMEEQVIGIVAKEISVDVNRDAICAQCVIARTNLYDAKEKGSNEYVNQQKKKKEKKKDGKVIVKSQGGGFDVKI